MSVHGLNHANLRVADPAATMEFFAQVLGMTVRRSETGSIGGGGMLIDADGNDILHVGRSDSHYPTDDWHSYEPTGSAGTVHHVALTCKGYAEVRKRLDSAGISYRKAGIREIGLRQLFIVEPGGLLVELNFRET